MSSSNYELILIVGLVGIEPTFSLIKSEKQYQILLQTHCAPDRSRTYILLSKNQDRMPLRIQARIIVGPAGDDPAFIQFKRLWQFRILLRSHKTKKTSLNFFKDVILFN